MTSDVIVSALARLKVANNTKVHEVRLMLEELEGQTYTYTTVASIPIRMYPGTPNGAYVYRDLATPVRLLSGKTYILVSREFYNVGESYCGESGVTNLNRGGQFVAFMDVDPYKPKACWFPWNTDGSLGTRNDGTVSTCLGGVNLKYH